METEHKTAADLLPQSGAGTSVRDRMKWIYLILAVVIPFGVILGIRIATLSHGGECSADSYYHVKISEMGPSVFAAKEFPWTAYSIWNDKFADKELLYHTVLWGITGACGLFGISPAPPFHVPAMFFILLTLIGFVYAARRMDVSPPVILLCSFITATFIPNYVYRLIMLRPHVLSIALLFLACGLLAKDTLKFRAISIFILSFIYAWSYSNPHFIVIPVLCFSIFAVKRDSWKVLLLPLLAFAGVILGLIIHPQFPNSFIIWKLQSWDALVSPLLSSSSVLMRPMEMMAPGWKWHRHAIPLYIMVYLNILMLIRVTERNGFKKVDPNIFALAAFSLIFVAGTFVAMRSVEYAMPFSALLFAVLIDKCVKEDLLIPFRKTPWKLYASLGLIALIFAGISTNYCIHIKPEAHPKPVPGLAQWLKENIPADEKIINIDWSDFPVLFYFDSGHRWLWGMDPVFAIAASPRETELLSSLQRPQELYSKLGIPYAVLLEPRSYRAEQLKNYGWQVVFENEEGWVFRLKR